MKWSKFTKEQIAFTLKQQELGVPIHEICLRLRVSEHTFYRRKTKFGGTLPSDIKRIKQLEEKNRKLQQMVADPATTK